MSETPARPRRTRMIDREPEAVAAAAPGPSDELLAARARIAELEAQLADLHRALSALRR